jgi:SNF2 family DNA or RNA helicase
MNKLRQLSDGFQYAKIKTPTDKPCKQCEGTGELEDNGELIRCEACEGTGKHHKVTKEIKGLKTPKTRVFTELLSEYEEYGRFVAYSPFHATIDHITETALKHGWAVMQLDGRGVKGFGEELEGMTIKDMLAAFQAGPVDSGIKKLLFNGQPESAGMGLTLTASPGLVFFSNSLKPEARDQAKDRIHRLGADLNKAVVVIDLIHLPQDEFIRTKLLDKADLHDMSLGKIQAELNEFMEKWETENAVD